MPTAVDFLPPNRFALRFEGGAAAVDAQVAACPGERADPSVWQEDAERQLGSGGRRAFTWRESVLGRPGVGISYVAEPQERAWSALAERVRATFDPDGVLA